jgi:hypothetical protein
MVLTNCTLRLESWWWWRCGRERAKAYDKIAAGGASKDAVKIAAPAKGKAPTAAELQAEATLQALSIRKAGR